MLSKISLYHLAQWVSNGLPRDACVWLGERLADLHWRRFPLDRAAVQSNLAVVLNNPVCPEMVREVFHNFARYLVEFLSAHRLSQQAMTLEGAEQLTRTLRSNQGSIILSAHMGNWELGAIFLRRLGFPVSVVALSHHDPRVNRFFDLQRLRCGVAIVPLGARATHQCLERLRTGQLLGILGDREFGSNGMTLSFFGRQATLPRGPAILSLRTGAPVVPVFLIREGPWRFRFYSEPPIWPPQGRWSTTHVQQLTQTYVKVIERYILRFPSQWLMFQPLTDEQAQRSANCELPIAD